MAILKWRVLKIMDKIGGLVYDVTSVHVRLGSPRAKGFMTQYPIRADEYRARANAEASLGAAASLDQVRAKHERASQVWADLANTEELRAAERAARTAAVGALHAVDD